MSFLLLPLPLLAIPAIVLLRDRARTIYGTLAKDAAQKDIVLPYSPTELTSTDILTIMLHLLMKYIPFYGAPQLTANGEGFILPPLRLSGPLRIRENDIALFKTAVKSSQASTNAANPLLLVSLTTPLVITTLTHPASPIKPIGAVNTRNRFTIHNAKLCSSASELLKASAGSKLTYSSSMGSEGRRKKRGVEFDVTITVFYEAQPVLTQRLYFLQFSSKSTRPLYKEPEGGEQPAREKLQETNGRKTNVLTVPATGPREYAASCKDYNPIHVSSLAAKLFGFKGVIAHGNYVAALMMQRALDTTDTAAEGDQNLKTSPQHMVARLLASAREHEKPKEVIIDVAFVKPVSPLPAELEVEWQQGSTHEGTQRVELSARLKGKVCVTGGVQ